MLVRVVAFGFPVALNVATQPPKKPLLLFVLFALVAVEVWFRPQRSVKPAWVSPVKCFVVLHRACCGIGCAGGYGALRLIFFPLPAFALGFLPLDSACALPSSPLGPGGQAAASGGDTIAFDRFWCDF